MRNTADSKEENMYEKVFAIPNPATPNQPVRFDAELCTGCNSCVDACHTDIFIPNPEKGKAPIILYPDECWFCGSCVEQCPMPGAIRMEHPLNQKVGWKRKTTGEIFRIGMKNPPPPNNRPPVGGW